VHPPAVDTRGIYNTCRQRSARFYHFGEETPGSVRIRFGTENYPVGFHLSPVSRQMQESDACGGRLLVFRWRQHDSDM